MKKLLLLPATLLILSACKKDAPEPLPQSCFSLSATTIMAGESVAATNCSSGATLFLWTGNDASTDKDHTFTYSSEGAYQISLSATNTAGTSTSSQYVQVLAPTGKAIFWFDNSKTRYNTVVTILSESRQISTAYTTTPDCDASGTATFNLPVGTYNFTATDGSKNWSGSVAVTKRGCTIKQLL